VTETFSRTEAFERNLGLLSGAEQDALAGALVTIVGCGGVGGLHAHTLARLGVGRFRLIDPDIFALANFNRQIGATIQNLGANKAQATAAMIGSINPEASIEVVEGALTAQNAARLVGGSSLVVDGVDFFALAARRKLFAAAWEARIPALTAAPLGFSATLHVFARGGMTFDSYFDLRDGQPFFDQLVRFLAGLAPRMLHLPYMDLASIDAARGRGPSSIVGTQLASSLVGAEAVRLLLKRGPSRLAPRSLQFDAYRQRLVQGRLIAGNRGTLQRLKISALRRRLRRLGVARLDTEPKSV
jgi:molybdopterin/thiamine biosynthesis adenylyltransferase